MNRVLGTLVVLAALPGQRRAPFLSRRRLDAVRDARIRRIVGYAARTVPHYRELFARERIDPRDVRGAAELDALPLVDPDDVRRTPERFRSDSRRARGALGFLTSGATGRPMEIHHDQRSVLENIAYGERERAPVIALAGGSFRPRELYIGYETSNFRKVTAFYAAATRLPVKPRRTPVSMVMPFEDIVAAVNAAKPDVLTAYGSFLDVFFRTLAARGARIHPPKVVMYMGEALPADRRAWIEETLGARVLSRYCATEAFKIGYFCEERTGFHVHEDLCHVRVRRADGSLAAPDEPGRVVISNLVNHATVLLNYPMGDVAALSSHACACGRTHRLLSEIQGRVEDVLRLPGGETLHPRAVWAALKDDRSILQYQLIQHDVGRFELRLATLDEDAFRAARDRAQHALRPLLGADAAIEASWHADLGRSERERSGKFRAVQSRVPVVSAGRS
jgi:phenylacetate-CoA ligase